MGLTICATCVLLVVIFATIFKKFWEERKEEKILEALQLPLKTLTLFKLPQSNEYYVNSTTTLPLKFNNQAQNNAIATSGQYLLICLLFFIGICGQLLTPMEKVVEYPWLTFPRHMLFPGMFALVIPCGFYIWNHDARKHVRELFQEAFGF